MNVKSNKIKIVYELYYLNIINCLIFSQKRTMIIVLNNVYAEVIFWNLLWCFNMKIHIFVFFWTI